MRRTTMMLAVVGLLVALVAPAAYAAVIYCSTNPCYGTSEADQMVEGSHSTVTAEEIYGGPRADDIDAGYFYYDDDYLAGQGGKDFLYARDGDILDELNGGRRYDVCVVDRDPSTGARDATRNCEEVRVRDLPAP